MPECFNIFRWIVIDKMYLLQLKERKYETRRWARKHDVQSHSKLANINDKDISGGVMRGTGGSDPPKSQKSAKIVKEKWQKISWVYL